MTRCVVLIGLVTVLVTAPAPVAGGGPARAEPSSTAAATPRTEKGCLRELERLKVSYKPAERRGIAIGVEVLGPIGGVSYRGYKPRPLVLDCSLVVSLARVGRYMSAQGIERATYSSSYQRRKVSGTNRWSKHSYGLAIDVHILAGDALGRLRIADDFEQGLGDDVDCIGRPLTRGGELLKTLECQFRRSELFYSILGPDYNAAHYNHFHLEARPWSERRYLPAQEK